MLWQLFACFNGFSLPSVFLRAHTNAGRKLDMLTEIMNRDKGTKDPESESNYEWGVGAAKKQKQEDAQQLLQEEREQPFARLPDDPSLDAHYRSIQRWGDPMAGLVSEVSSPSYFVLSFALSVHLNSFSSFSEQNRKI